MEYLLNPDPLLRSHAAWASIRLGHKELVDLARNDSDPLVLKEIMLAEVEGYLWESTYWLQMTSHQK